LTLRARSSATGGAFFSGRAAAVFDVAFEVGEVFEDFFLAVGVFEGWFEFDGDWFAGFDVFFDADVGLAAELFVGAAARPRTLLIPKSRPRSGPTTALLHRIRPMRNLKHDTRPPISRRQRRALPHHSVRSPHLNRVPSPSSMSGQRPSGSVPDFKPDLHVVVEIGHLHFRRVAARAGLLARLLRLALVAAAAAATRGG